MYKDGHVSFIFSHKSCKSLVQYNTKYIGLDIVKIVLKYTKYSIIWKHNIIFSFKCLNLFFPVLLTTAFRFIVSNVSRNHSLVLVLRGNVLSSTSNKFLSVARFQLDLSNLREGRSSLDFWEYLLGVYVGFCQILFFS